MTAISGLSANRLGAFPARAMQQFHVTMRRCAMLLSPVDGTEPSLTTDERRQTLPSAHDDSVAPFLLSTKKDSTIHLRCRVLVISKDSTPVLR